jgi:hypothetical protein
MVPRLMETGLSANALAETLIELALKQGAEAAEVLQSESRSHPVSFEANRLKQLDSSTSLGTALRLWMDGRPGLVVAYGHVDPESMVEKPLTSVPSTILSPLKWSPGRRSAIPIWGRLYRLPT